MTISRSTLYARIREGAWQRRRYSPSAAADEAPVAATAVLADVAVHAIVQAAVAADGEPLAEPDQSPADAVTVEKRAALFARAFRAAELQMDSIEAAMKQLCTAPAPFERTARALAMLNRSLRDILALTRADETGLPNEADDNSIPRDMDAFRDELACRINALIEARAGGTSGDIGGVAGDAEPGRS
jgi:hypothetical protein